MAWRKISVTLTNMGGNQAGQMAAIATAFRHRDRLTESERLLTEGYYYTYGPSAGHREGDCRVRDGDRGRLQRHGSQQCRGRLRHEARLRAGGAQLSRGGIGEPAGWSGVCWTYHNAAAAWPYRRGRVDGSRLRGAAAQQRESLGGAVVPTLDAWGHRRRRLGGAGRISQAKVAAGRTAERYRAVRHRIPSRTRPRGTTLGGGIESVGVPPDATPGTAVANGDRLRDVYGAVPRQSRSRGKDRARGVGEDSDEPDRGAAAAMGRRAAVRRIEP